MSAQKVSPAARARQKPPSRSTRAFTLLELMFASAFFLLGLAGVITMETNAGIQLARAEHQNRASQLASGTLALCQLLPSASVLAMSTPVAVSYDVNGRLVGSTGAGPSFYAVTSTTSAISAAQASVKVSVAWTEPRNQQARQVTAEETVATP